MSSRDRRQYLTSSVLDQALLNACADNFETKIEMVVDIQAPDGSTIYASDRNKYVGGTFYEALLVFPVINRTVGEWLAPVIQYSTLTLELSNADSRFNDLLPGGSDYGSFIGKTVIVKIGLAEAASTYKTIFSGRVTDTQGFARSTFSITLIARDDSERFNINFPRSVLSRSVYPDLDDSVAGTVLPAIYGDFTVNLDPDAAIVPAYPLNGNDANVIGGTRDNVQFIISQGDLLFFDPTKVYYKKSDIYFLVPAIDVVNVGANNNTFEVRQNTTSWADGAPYEFAKGDAFFVQVKGKDLGAYSDNPVWQARDLLISEAGALSGDFNSNWASYRDKASPPQSAIASIKSRIWENEPKPVMEYALSILEQLRLEAFFDEDQLLKINSLHFEDWEPSPSFTVKNWDVVEKTLVPKVDELNNFNRAQGNYDFHPVRNELARSTSVYRNPDSFTQTGRYISKQISFPNLYIESDVNYQVIEILRLSSSLFEKIECSLTWRSLLLDIGDFVLLNVQIGSIIYENVPAMLRSKGYDPKGIQIPVTLWSMQLVPFPGYEPGYFGTIGGYNQTIEEE